MGNAIRAWRLALGAMAAAALSASLLAGVAVADEGLAAGSAVQSAVTVQGAPAAGAVSVQASSGKTGWKETKSGKVYYRKGVKVTGLQKIGGERYYFNSKGILKTSDVKVGKYTYYVNEDGVLFGAKAGSTCYYSTLKRMTDDDAYDFETFLQARSIVKDITNEGDSKEEKLHKAFDWVMYKYYAIHRPFDPYQTNWPAIFARDHFDDQGGDCHADGAAFAYLAAAIGYEADVCLDAMIVGTPGSHCWAMIGNKVYDPLFAQAKDYWGYYGVTSGTYETSPTARYRVPQFDPANASQEEQASKSLANAGKTGLKKVGGSYYYFKNGKKLKNTWKTVKGKRYYFKKSGKAATLSTKVKGAYYVFNKKGVLQKGSVSGKRLVKIGSSTYQVTKSGKASAGWSSDKKKYFDKTGLLLTGVNLIGKKFYAADDKGVYDKDLTSQLNKAAVKGQPAIALRKLLGEPDSAFYSQSCDFAGDDGLWTYKNFIVTTARLEGVAEMKASDVASYTIGAKLEAPYETVATVQVPR